MPGSWTDLDKNNIVMASIEDLGEEEQRNYAALQEYLKQQFLAGIKKDRHNKVVREQEFVLPSIKLNDNRIEVIPNVSETPSSIADLSSKIETIIKNQGDTYNSIGARLSAL